MDFNEEMIENMIVWLTGGIAYFMIEQLVRGYSHISMFICGGFSLLVVGKIGVYIERVVDKKWKYYIYLMLAGGSIITLLELCTGIVVNKILKLEVWDYGNMVFNYKGQICLLYSVIWGIASIFCGKIDKILRNKIFR